MLYALRSLVAARGDDPVEARSGVTRLLVCERAGEPLVPCVRARPRTHSKVEPRATPGAAKSDRAGCTSAHERAYKEGYRAPREEPAMVGPGMGAVVGPRRRSGVPAVADPPRG